MTVETRPDVGYVDPGEGYSSFRDDNYYNTGGGLSLQPSNNTGFANDPFEGMPALEITPTQSTDGGYYSTGLSLQPSQNAGGNQLDWGLNIQNKYTDRFGNMLNTPKEPDKEYVLPKQEFEASYPGASSSVTKALLEDNGIIVRDAGGGNVSVTGIGKLDKFYSDKIAANARVEKMSSGDNATMNSAYLLAGTTIVSILAQIWMNKEAQKQNEKNWDKAAAENRATAMYNRTGSWTGETATGGGGGGGAGTGPKLTGIKGYV